LPMIKENGFDSVSVDDICSAAGIAKGTFYHYFASKEKIFGETGIIMNDIEIDHLLNDEQVSSIDKVFYLIRAYTELAKSQGVDITRQLFKAFLDGNDIYTEKTSGTQMLRVIIAEGQKKKEINPNLTVDEIVDLVFAFTSGLILYWLNSNGDYDLTIKANNLFEKWLKHILDYTPMDKISNR
jgi:AcrR family transcriptional regulator